eukprot:TRINITY_DN9053_c0_g1_i3.p3 TRINITY_DN9053_c0_g1~~TRINITY_DN9053_c0_g1_i3.p3  ORF type:complete len:180 (-),score=28.93 TRINITY_DN9053_c0_g1_i3:555-1094(-)
MKKLQLDMLKIENDYMIIENDTFKIIFTNAENSRNFNRATDSGINELNSIKEEFRLWDVIYLKQIHSDKVLVYSLDKYIKDMEGDAIVTQEKNVAIGVFTADCVPIILVDKIKGVIAAIHSGWKGTFDSITLKTIEKMKNEFKCDNSNIKAYIGAHIRQCCYEVSEDLKDKFIQKKKQY